MISPKLADRIELRPVEALIPYARNARTHSPEQIDRIAASIAEFGFTNPILVDGENGIIAGHGRLAAARKLGLAQVPVIELAHLSPAQKRAYILADNRLALDAGWDEAMLAVELAELRDAGFELELTGFAEDEIERYLAEFDEEEGEEEEASEEGADEADLDEEVSPPRIVTSRPGDIWRLGRHRLICADSSDVEAIARLMAGEKAHLLFTSPPYANQRNYTTGGIEDWDAIMRGVFAAAMAAMREDGQMLVNLGLVHRDGSVIPYWDEWLKWMPRQGWRFFGWYVWDQGVTVPGDWAGRLAPRHEFIFHFNREARKPNKIVPCKMAGTYSHLSAINGGGGLRDKNGRPNDWTHADRPIQDYRIPDSVITVTRQRGPIDPEREIDHPAVFPIGLPTFVMEAYSNPGEIVFEPFSGSGTTILAGEACGRRVRASELAPEYVDVAVIRWLKTHPEQMPVLEATGQTWEEVKAEREPEGVVAASYGDSKKRLSDVFNDRMAKLGDAAPYKPWGRNAA
ncbi:DNA modification methylase [Tepidimonas ignava]|uniref:site-specific DNA-methyltransferase (cytosine-N(4)-specific) n=1 Tax=Tepidimonas ignava TaxID=114249 RepID=A0A4R3LH17_9BURK|nr:site-specific DNA-methyltransferase [Tepidimonas ignava]TCS98775.1 DNA modification methylase [Tepidimonas ignava]TSE20299.1 Modification methylase PvuII [Tepidimonas ignava]